MSFRQRWLLLSLFSLLAGCSSAAGIPETGNGELHQGTFVYACSSNADFECGATTATAPALPSGIAVGSNFDLRFVSAVPTKLEPSASFFTVDIDGTFHATRAGYGVVLVKDESGNVVDFVNLHVKTIASLEIDGLEPGTSLTVGETRTITAAAFDSVGVHLAGTLPLEWESADEDIATVTVTDSNRALGSATLHAVAAGTARIRVVTGASTGSLSFKVGS